MALVAELTTLLPILPILPTSLPSAPASPLEGPAITAPILLLPLDLPEFLLLPLPTVKDLNTVPGSTAAWPVAGAIRIADTAIEAVTAMAMETP